MAVTCQYCKKTISNEGNLKRHYKTKACLATRTPTEASAAFEDRYKCGDCNKYFRTPQTLKSHQKICVSRLASLIDQKDKMIEKQAAEKDEIISSQAAKIAELQEYIKHIRLEVQLEMLRKNEKNYERARDVIEKIAQQPKSTTNNLILSVIDTSQEAINSAVEQYYDRNHFFTGQKGVADFAREHILTDTHAQLGYVCTDVSRGTFKHMDEEGKVVKDVKAVSLTKKLARPIKSKAGVMAVELVEEYKEDAEMLAAVNENCQELCSIDEDNTKFYTQLGAITS